MVNKKQTEDGKGLGITSMILGIIGVLFAWIPIIGLPFCVLGLILGLAQKNWTKYGTAIAGVALNALWVSIQAIFIMLMLIGMFAGL